MTQRMVNCKKLGRQAPGLERPPFSGELGNQIFESVSAEAWQDWQQNMMIKIINEYRLNLADPQHYESLLKQMAAYLNLDSATQVLEVENEKRGRGNS